MNGCHFVDGWCSVVAGIFRYLPVWQVLICCLGQGVACPGRVWRNTGRDQGHTCEGGQLTFTALENCGEVFSLIKAFVPIACLLCAKYFLYELDL